MKVLFAVQDEKVSNNIVKAYQRKYKEIITYKNIYYFNAILKELQKNKSYDRIVIDEELEEFNSTNYAQKNKFIFDKLDNISDEASNTGGNDIPIILICSERRTKSEEIFVKLFGIGIYNAIIGNDRSTEEVCRLIRQPRTKKQAKIYYKIDSEEVEYKHENQNDVSEEEVQNILIHFKKMGKNDEKYVEDFSKIVKQYNDEQMKIIAKILPATVRAVLEEKSPEYQRIISGNAGMKLTSNKKNEKKGTVEKLLDKDNPKTKLNRPVVVPTSMQKSTVKRISVKKQPSTIINQEDFDEIEDIDVEVPEIQNNIKQPKVENVNVAKEQPIEVAPKKRGRGRPRKNPLPEENNTTAQTVGTPPKKRGRGRPRKNPLPEENVEEIVQPIETPEIEQEDIAQMPKQQNSNLNEVAESPMFTEKYDDETTELPGFENIEDYDDDDDEVTELPGFKDQEYEEEDDTATMPGFEDQEYEEDDDTATMPGFDEQEYEEDDTASMPGFDEQEYEEDDTASMPGFEDQEYEEDDDTATMPGFEDQEYEEDDTTSMPGFDEQEYEEDEDNNIIQQSTVQQNRKIEPRTTNYEYDDSNFENLLTSDKKVVTFVGTSKNGTSFIVNNVAQYLSLNGTDVAILDTTQNKNSYYIYTKNEEDLRSIASNSIPSLLNDRADGIRVNNNLAVYTAVPNEEVGIENAGKILETLVQNHSVVLIDCDFNTPYEYFSKSQEIYLVQSMDVLTIQPLTAFLRDLKAKDIIDQNKIRIILNKVMNLRGVSSKNIIGGMAFYNDPEMSFMTELFNREAVKYLEIPFDEEVYAQYLEGIIECEIMINKYPKNFQPKLKDLAGMVYPLLPNNRDSRKTDKKKKGYDYSGGFSSSVNNTLNNMKRNY